MTTPTREFSVGDQLARDTLNSACPHGIAVGDRIVWAKGANGSTTPMMYRTSNGADRQLPHVRAALPAARRVELGEDC